LTQFHKKIIIENNIIKKTIIDLQYNGSEDAFDLQKKITDWSGKSLASTLENVFEKIKVSDNILIIDKMELDIVIDEQGNWVESLSKEVADQLIKHLESYKDSDNVSGIIKKSVNGNFFEAFIYFLQQGVLPWWSDIKDQNIFFEQLDKLLQTGLMPEMKTTLSSLFAEEKIIQRTIWQIPDNLFYQMIFNLSPEIRQQTERIRMDIDKMKSFASLEEKKLLDFVFKKVLLTGIGKAEEKHLIDKFTELIKNLDHQLTLLAVLQKAVVEIKDKHFKTEIKKLLALAIKSQKSSKDKPEESSPDTLKEVKLRESENERQINGRHKESKRKETEGIYIKDAGLVIVAGFLSMIFKKLSIVDDNKITDINKAVCLVHFLAEGESNFAEFELGLAKVLCGIQMEAPIDTSIVLSDDEKQEANELLLSVIEYWSILKDTSVEGLRESFLMRKGKLSFTDNEWLLQIEQKPYDMLLQNIPWNISMIKLPWMDYLLKTEWIF